ncbi:hypothetical protein [Mycoplasmopsis meleagridis]|uniref:hypothetical protein n=1 Tax=Mycoplasmopsis meleagridis TaxID=29561 RepID=UPI00073D5CD4|nr:hypothetical protein [Mycoplasmopsis meleagridis]KUH47289.1 hypothetical protein ASB56_02105 [Mycoplasmopsis meleagridis]
MNCKDKLLVSFLTIITFGLCWVYWKKKNQKQQNLYKGKIELDKKINLEELVLFLGKKDNITNIESSASKVTIFFQNKALIDINSIKKIKYITGMMINNNKITLIVGEYALSIANELRKRFDLS